MGGSKTTSTTSNAIDPQLKAMYLSNYNTAQGVANTPFQPFTGEAVAPFSATQKAGQQGLIDVGNSNIGSGDLNAASGAFNGILNYQPSTVAAGQLASTDLTPYLNPFTKDVINSSLNTLNTQRGQQRVSDNQAATAAHAFGGSRQGVADALTNQLYDQNAGNLIAGLNSANFSQAQGAAGTDISNRLNADEFNTNAGLTGANLRLNAGTSLANLSNEQLTQALQKAGVIEGVGQEQTAQQQAIDDASYQEFLRKIGYPAQQQSIRNSALGLIPLQQTQTTTQKTSSNPFTSVLGGILGLGQTAGSLGWSPF